MATRKPRLSADWAEEDADYDQQRKEDDEENQLEELAEQDHRIAHFAQGVQDHHKAQRQGRLF